MLTFHSLPSYFLDFIPRVCNICSENKVSCKKFKKKTRKGKGVHTGQVYNCHMSHVTCHLHARESCVSRCSWKSGMIGTSSYPKGEKLDLVCAGEQGGVGVCVPWGIAYQLGTHPTLTFLARCCSAQISVCLILIPGAPQSPPLNRWGKRLKGAARKGRAGWHLS